jgi:putative acetyltransferase
MPPTFYLKRTTTDDDDFRLLINLLDHELWNELSEDQATYDQYNKVPHLNTAVVLYVQEEPAGCGCFKEINEKCIEIKRMFVKKAFRGKGFSRIILNELEAWAKSLHYTTAVLETSVHFATAQNLYSSTGYDVIPNYPPYDNLPESVCMKKTLLV